MIAAVQTRAASRRWTFIWVLLAVIALWWPGRITSRLDGIPLTSLGEGVVLGLLLPALCVLAPSFLSRRGARFAIGALLAWKVVTSATLVQGGWCVRMMPEKAYVADGTGAPHSWDIRADWLSADPVCSAIMTRGYQSDEQFPVWFFNLSSRLSDLPLPDEQPPLARILMTVDGAFHTSQQQAFSVVTNEELTPQVRIDGVPVSASGAVVAPGTHVVHIETWLTGHRRFDPLLNEMPVWNASVATTTLPSRLDLFLRPWAAWICDLVVGGFLATWFVVYARAALTLRMGVFTVVASIAMALCAQYVSQRYWHFVLAGLTMVCFLRPTPQMRTRTGAFWLIGVPWLVLAVSYHAPQFGRITFYTPGDDFWQFQRYAYRIFLQGYWLEGGEPTFWFQPLYRWICGALHMIFGDSSVGEAFWDATCVVFMSIFAFAVVDAIASARWALFAAVLTLVSFVGGPSFTFIGRGLSEISSAGFLYLGALLAMQGHRSWRADGAAGACATLGTWTRLNNLPMAIGVATFAWPLSVRAVALRRPLWLFEQVSWRTVVSVVAALILGFLLFAFRTWHYVGVFSVFAGTQIDSSVRGVSRQVWNSNQPVAANLYAVFDSVMMVLTTTDPPRFHLTATPVLAGAAIAALAVVGIGPIGRVPLAPVLFCLSSIAGAVVARGTAYAGRFSIHVIGATVTVLVCALAITWQQINERWWQQKTTPAGGRADRDVDHTGSGPKAGRSPHFLEHAEKCRPVGLEDA